MLFCCGQRVRVKKTVYPCDTERLKNQKLEVGYCTEHGGLICELTFYDKKTDTFRRIRPRRKNVRDFIKKVENDEFTLDRLLRKVGNKSNMAFRYGENIERKDRIQQYAVDFNGTRTLEKEILFVM